MVASCPENIQNVHHLTVPVCIWEEYHNKTIHIYHNKQVLEVVRLTRMTSVKETALFLSQPLQFSSTMNPFSQIPIINSPVIKSIYIASIVPGISAEHSDLDCLLMMTDFQLFNKEWYICLPLRA